MAYDDAALPIGDEQTISQPYMVALICEQLALHGDERVLDVGTGSGYQAAVLAELAAEVHSHRADRRSSRRARARTSPRPATQTASTCTSATARAASRSARRSPRSRSPPPRRGRRPRSTSSSSRAAGSSSRSAAPAEQWLEVVVRTPEGPAVLRTVPCRFVPLVAG